MSHEVPRKCFLPLYTGVQDQARPLCSIDFHGSGQEPGVLLCQFLSSDRGKIVCEGLDHIFEHDCLDDFMSLRCQLPGYSPDSRPLLFLDAIPIKRYEIGRIIAEVVHDYMKNLNKLLNSGGPDHNDNPSLSGIEWEKLYLSQFYTMDGKEWEVMLSMELPQAFAEQ